MAEANFSISEITFPFRIENASKLKSLWSPEIVVQNVPLKINPTKLTFGSRDWLGINLYCAIEDESPDWSHAVSTTIKLVSLNGNNIIENFQTCSFVFDCSYPKFVSAVFEWEDLFKPENNYVKDDTIKMKIHIVVADPKEKNPSKMLFETIKKSCAEGCSNKYRLTITNIDKFMAVKTPRFIVRNLPFVLMINRRITKLSAELFNSTSTADNSCKLQMSLKLISSKGDMKSIEVFCREVLFKKGTLPYMEPIVSWDELIKPENGFVNDNAIVIEVDIKSEGGIPIDQNAPKRLKFECSICLEAFGTQEVSSTLCGHLFCTPCLKNWVEARGNCPACNKKVELDSWHRIYPQR